MVDCTAFNRMRRYDASVHFNTVLGADDPNLVFLPPEATLFFFFELASLHSALGEDRLAVILLWRALGSTPSLPAGQDTAVVWSGLGRAACRLGKHHIAARAVSRARLLRERRVGEDTIEAATTYNNLACCLVEIDRQWEAMAYLELAVAILQAVVGQEHPRTQTAQRNFEKVRAAPKGIICEEPHIFIIPVKDDLRVRKRRKSRRRLTRTRSSSRAKSQK